jgi:hypothetical protein
MSEPLSIISLPSHQGRFYQDCMHDLHKAIVPKTYFEIGTLAGDTLRLASCRSIAVDPAFRLSKPSVGGKPTLHMFQMESDSFFEAHDPISILGGPIDLAFLDGMHLFEFLLRDFIHTERACHSGSTVVLHDCVPTDPFMATRDVDDHKTRSKSRHPLWWTGDVWKVVVILQHYRPDLTVTIFDAPPTGLVVITGLDPTNRTLSKRYDSILAPKPACPWRDDGIGRYLSTVVLTPTSSLLGCI